MTIIVWDGKTLAADKRAVNAGYTGGVVTKIHRWAGGLCAFAGDYDLGMAMVQWLRGGCKLSEYPARQRTEDNATFFVIHRDGRFERYEREPIPLPFENLPQCTGSGRDYAYAAIYMGADARRAVEVACHFDSGCGNGIDTLTLNAAEASYVCSTDQARSPQLREEATVQ